MKRSLFIDLLPRLLEKRDDDRTADDYKTRRVISTVDNFLRLGSHTTAIHPPTYQDDLL